MLLHSIGMKVPAFWKPTELNNTVVTDYPIIPSLDSYQWRYVLEHDVCYEASIFDKMVMELVYHPERTSSVIMRTDILRDSQNDSSLCKESKDVIKSDSYQVYRSIVRRIIPRNQQLDACMEQDTILLKGSNDHKRILLYLPKLDLSLEEPYNHLPYYHPAVAGVALEYTSTKLRVAYLLNAIHQKEISTRLQRTANMLLMVLHKHCKGSVEGYEKRMLHDTVVERNNFQDTYVELKRKYSKKLIEGWVEKTDPGKHVFEDLGIAAFLIELWKQMYSSKKSFTFVDVGCGNGLLVHILLSEGYLGYGFDARERRSWKTYPDYVQENLSQKVLVPFFLKEIEDQPLPFIPVESLTIHDGRFPVNSFIIGNHADELTPYIPILARLNKNSSFMSIPCCVHDLTGAKISWSLPKPRDKKHGGRYAMYIEWIRQISERFDWNIEIEPLRIPSTRNYALIGRSSKQNASSNDTEFPTEVLKKLIDENHGASGFLQHAMQVATSNSRSH
ncbi:tRNA methyltransferase [Schizosaccharomyces cryophilus OY26]|uniref:tRNA (uracil-O(2)-)-methyltransferase n=1 Tax=Schizosaccharomyces cryophilus (strain OY26 / ATCC MYA-4695 / CBS 11777 / NBRC 106824 / NRRL Y48691) TaxID=653667 RepID=S9XDZ5_SCHCR|nr:tRNA methyltransferase [Schizosaccharomyces cryophilus OY26]EPY52001.1 tRNA methyltransferase [Schizosaccharomyces cryophilus OY26]